MKKISETLNVARRSPTGTTLSMFYVIHFTCGGDVEAIAGSTFGVYFGVGYSGNKRDLEVVVEDSIKEIERSTVYFS